MLSSQNISVSKSDQIAEKLNRSLENNKLIIRELTEEQNENDKAADTPTPIKARKHSNFKIDITPARDRLSVDFTNKNPMLTPSMQENQLNTVVTDLNYEKRNSLIQFIPQHPFNRQSVVSVNSSLDKLPSKIFKRSPKTIHANSIIDKRKQRDSIKKENEQRRASHFIANPVLS